MLLKETLERPSCFQLQLCFYFLFFFPILCVLIFACYFSWQKQQILSYNWGKKVCTSMVEEMLRERFSPSRRVEGGIEGINVEDLSFVQSGTAHECSAACNVLQPKQPSSRSVLLWRLCTQCSWAPPGYHVLLQPSPPTLHRRVSRRCLIP